MSKKKILMTLIICSILVITICILLSITSKLNQKSDGSMQLEKSELTSGENINKVSTYVTDDIKELAENVEVSAELDKEITLSDLVSSTENIAIVRIISLDSSSAKYDQVVGNTYGKLIVNTVIKGDLKEGQKIDYAALGGYLKIAEWEQYQPKAANEKRDLLRKRNGIVVDKEKDYMHLQFENCVDAEEGKTYLAYLNYNNQMGKYEIVGFADGLMELSIKQEHENISTININTEEVKIRNNYTKAYTSLKEYIEKIDSICDK